MTYPVEAWRKLRSEGMSYRKIGNRYGVSYMTVSNWCNGKVSTMVAGRRGRKPIPIDDATIALWREAYRAGASYRQIAEGAGVSRDTVIRRCNMTSRAAEARQQRRRIAELEQRVAELEASNG